MSKQPETSSICLMGPAAFSHMEKLVIYFLLNLFPKGLFRPSGRGEKWMPLENKSYDTET